MNAFLSTLKAHDIKGDVLKRGKLTTLQINLGDLCNQICQHCHIEASPQAKNIMSKKVVDDILKFISRYKIERLDITGGAPELNPNFDYLVNRAGPLVKELIIRSNLTVIFEPGKDYLPNFFKENRVHLICSLPCYTKENVDRQRGIGVFEKSIKALRILNDLGFGKGNGLQLDLAHNPLGANLPLEQDKLEIDYKHNLNKEYGIVFNRLIAITNAPLGRFNEYLQAKPDHQEYSSLLRSNFNVETLEKLMCLSLLSVGFDGRIYDCDFNLAKGFTLKDEQGKPFTIDALTNPDEWRGKEIIFAEHCFACTAGFGSSCQGALDLNVVRDNVKYFYKEAAIQPKRELCCAVTYDEQDVSYIPKEILDVSYGCGSPVTLAEPKPGEVVLDLGCGAGIDCFIAAKKVGITGKVIGIDMTEEMLNKANNALEKVVSKLGFLNCEFRHGFLENLPVESESVDLVTSNCVINLSIDKYKVFKEIFRVLRDEGRFVISDIVSDTEVPVYLKENQKLWGECISGALTQSEFLSKAKEAGFYGLELIKNFKYRKVEGIQFFSLTLRAYKFKKNKDCRYIGQYATYLGPYLEVRDEDEHIFIRGVAQEVCTDTAHKLSKPPYAGQFMLTEIGKEQGEASGCSPDTEGNKCC